MAGGIGAKKVDITWATEEAGLLLAVSIKTINFRDGRTGNFQKNLAVIRFGHMQEAGLEGGVGGSEAVRCDETADGGPHTQRFSL